MVQNTLNALVTEGLVYTALKQVIDPELGINVVDLGLIYDVHIGDDGSIGIEMTLTTPGCPLHASFREAIEEALWLSLPDITDVTVELVWDPPWTPEKISSEGLAELGLY